MANDPFDLSDLEGILLEAKREAEVVRKVNDPRTRWTDPDMWQDMGQVQLVYREGSLNVLIGLFNVLHHKRVLGTRKLTFTTVRREETPPIEYVSGEHWLPSQTMEVKHTPAITIKQAEFKLALDMGVESNYEVPVSIHLTGGGVSAITLDEATRFDGFTPRTILFLPEGLDILEGLTHDCKKAIWEAIKE